MSFRDFVEAVRDRSDLVEVIGADVELRRSGSMMRGLSPFRTETTPSFVVWPETRTWHDFSGGSDRGGDVFDYIQERRNCGFREAVYLLAERAGMKRPDQTDEEHEREVALMTERREVERLLSAAAAYYHRALPAEIREESYRAHYGLTDEIIDRLLLGWADGQLFNHFGDDLGAAREMALKTGLFVVIPGGEVVDFFKNRLVLPYWKGGRVVYFIGRRSRFSGDEEWEQPKYKKLRTRSEKRGYISATIGNDYFYNEDAARGADQILVTEGVTDCISAMQAGLACISPVTTRFRSDDAPKLLALTRSAKRIIICNDAEASGAGEAGALATAAALVKEGRDVRIATLPRAEGVDKIDVNEFLKAHPADDLRAVLDAAKPYVEYLLERIARDTAPSELEKALAPVIEAVLDASPVERDRYRKLISKRFSLDQRTVKALVQEAQAKRAARKQREATAAAGDSEDGAARGGDDISASPPRDRVRGQVFQTPTHYCAYDRNNNPEVLSSFVVLPTERVVTEDSEMIIADLRTARGQMIRGVQFPKNAWHSKRDFLCVLPSPDLQWTGTDDNVQGLLRIVSAVEVPRRRGTKNLGYLETPEGPRWVAPGVVIGPDGFHENSEIFYVAGQSTLARRMRYAPVPLGEARALAASVLPLLLALNEPAVILPIIGWFFATPFRPRLLGLLGHFPILMIWGSQGSGKSSIIEEIFWLLFGVVHDRKPYSATETEFALISLLSASDSVPIFIDEYRRDMKKEALDRIHRFLRRIYGGETEERGRSDQTITSYRLSAPVCLAGESRPEDAALAERFISVSPNKFRLKDRPEYKKAFAAVRALDFDRLAAPYIQFALGRDTATDLNKARAATERLISNVSDAAAIPDRCRDNLVVMVFGLFMYTSFSKSLGVDLPDLDVAPAISACIKDVVDGDSGAKDQFDRFLEYVSTMAHVGKLFEGTHYASVGGLLCLHLKSCYQEYLKERRTTGLDDETNGERALRRLIRENYERKGYVVEIDKRVVLDGGRSLHTVAIDLSRVPETLEITEFPTAEDRSHGGARPWLSGRVNQPEERS